MIANCQLPIANCQAELPGMPPGNSLAALRERERQLEREVADMRTTFNVCGIIEDGFTELAVQLSEVKKQVAESVARGGLNRQSEVRP